MSTNDEKTKELETKVSQLTLQLTDSNARVTALTSEHATQLSAVTAERDALKAKLDTIEEEKVNELVDITLATYGEKRGLTDVNRPTLLRYAKLDRPGFLEMYPLVPPGQRHLSMNITGGPHNTPTPRTPPMPENEGGGGGTRIDMKAVTASVESVDSIAARLMSDAQKAGTPMARETAYSQAYHQHVTLVKDALKKQNGV